MQMSKILCSPSFAFDSAHSTASELGLNYQSFSYQLWNKFVQFTDGNSEEIDLKLSIQNSPKLTIMEQIVPFIEGNSEKKQSLITNYETNCSIDRTKKRFPPTKKKGNWE